MKKLEVKLADETMTKLDELVRQARQSRVLGDFASRSEIIRMLIEKEWMIQQQAHQGDEAR